MKPDLQPQITQMNTDEPAAEKHLRSSVPSAAKEKAAPKISVIVPVYKVEKYLPECIESVLAQTFTDFELILVDDGSPDNSGKICDAYAARDSRIRVFHKENGGVSSARNLGLDNACGEWIAFVDSDDSVSPNFLQNIMECTATSTNPPAAVFFAFGCRKDSLEDDSPSPVLSSNDSGFYPFIFYLWKRDLFGYTCCKIFQRKIIVQCDVRFREDFALCEDLLFTLDYLCAAQQDSAKCELLLLDKKLYFYRQPEKLSNPIRHDDSFLMQERITEQVRNCLLELEGDVSSDKDSSLAKIMFARAHRAFVAGFIADFHKKGRFPKFSETSETLVWQEITRAKWSDVREVLNSKWSALFLLRILPAQIFFRILSLKILHSIKTR